MPLVPPITPTNPGGDRQFQTAWEDLLRVLNRAHRNRIVVAVPLANPVPQGYGQVDRYAVDSIGGNAPDYVLGRTNCTALSTSALSTNTLRAVPFRVEEPRRITSVAFRVTVAGGAGSKGRMAIYDSKGDESEGNWYPNQKVWQGTEFDTNASTGTKATSTTLDLKPGRRYWAVYWCGTSAPTVNAVPVAANGCDLASAAGTGTTYLSVALTYTSTGFPQTFPSGAIGVSTVAPALMLTMTRPTSWTSTLSQIGWVAPEGGVYEVRGAKVVKATAMPRVPSGRAFAQIEATVISGSKVDVLGSYDSREDALGAGSPRTLASNVGRVLKENDALAARVTVGGWPPPEVRDATILFDIGVL